MHVLRVSLGAYYERITQCLVYLPLSFSIVVVAITTASSNFNMNTAGELSCPWRTIKQRFVFKYLVEKKKKKIKINKFHKQCIKQSSTAVCASTRSLPREGPSSFLATTPILCTYRAPQSVTGLIPQLSSAVWMWLDVVSEHSHSRLTEDKNLWFLNLSVRESSFMQSHATFGTPTP